MAFEQPLPTALSPSRLADFQSCPRRYQHGAIERRHQPATYASVKGRFVHFLLERLMSYPPHDRTIDLAREAMPDAEVVILDDQARTDIGLTEGLLEQLRHESNQILTTYFAMEEPSEVNTEGVELRIETTIDETPLLGIIDRLDRDATGALVVVDYKTGSVPNRRFDSYTFANSELYAALCHAHIGERPSRIRLLYVAHGSVLERPVNTPTIHARIGAAQNAWARINQYYRDGEFPATPSANACRFCAFKDLCRANGVPVVIR